VKLTRIRSIELFDSANIPRDRFIIFAIRRSDFSSVIEADLSRDENLSSLLKLKQPRD